MRRGSKRNHLLDRFAGVPLLHGAALARRLKRPPSNWASVERDARRIGVLCSPALGDTLLFSAPLADLRQHFDRQAAAGSEPVEIVHLCMPENLPAAEIIAGADRRLVLNLIRPDQSIRRLRAERFDAVLDFTPWQRITALHTLLSGARFTAGFCSAGQARGVAYDLAVEHRRDCHELENFRAIPRALGIPSGAKPEILPDVLDTDGQNAACWAQLWRAATGSAEPPPQPDNLVVFHPWPAGTGRELREWPAERWKTLAAELTRLRPGLCIAVTGGPADEPQVRQLVGQLGAGHLLASASRVFGFQGPDGLRSVAALLRRARLAVAVNTGIMHLAAIAGTPTVGISGPTAEHRWGPIGPRVRSVTPADGSGGYLHFGFEHPRDTARVMDRISVEQVVRASTELLAQSRDAVAERSLAHAGIS
jgi:heptosyltransferase-3